MAALIPIVIPCSGRSHITTIYPLGDLHIGARNCAEGPLRRTIKEIENDPNALWFGGGDMTDCIAPNDPRFDFASLPDWMVESNKKMKVQEMLADIIGQQIDHLRLMLWPIRNKCLGIISGNHEDKPKKREYRDVHKLLCIELNVRCLPRLAWWRLTFRRAGGSAQVINMVAHHGWGSGRTEGSEPNKLKGLLDEFEDCELCFRGHSHSYAHIKKVVMYVPRSGELPPQFLKRYRHAANWGCWLYSHPVGYSPYEEEAGYPARAMQTVKAVVRPFGHTQMAGQDICKPHIEIREIDL